MHSRKVYIGFRMNYDPTPIHQLRSSTRNWVIFSVLFISIGIIFFKDLNDLGLGIAYFVAVLFGIIYFRIYPTIVGFHNDHFTIQKGPVGKPGVYQYSDIIALKFEKGSGLSIDYPSVIMKLKDRTIRVRCSKGQFDRLVEVLDEIGVKIS